MNKFLVTAAAAVALSTTAGITGVSLVSSAWAQASANPNDMVRTAVETVVKAAKADPAARNGDAAATARIVARDFLPYTDFRRTTRYAVGPKVFDAATPAQQEQVFQQFQQLLVNTYALQLMQVRGTDLSFKFAPAKLAPNSTDAVVGASVSGTGDNLSVAYRLAKTDKGWKIYDINMMGENVADAWLIQLYQPQFKARIAQGGIDGLIAYLRDKNERFGK
ncbi:ABC transporter substrate-binding protein [Pandoraea nosoerga]|uniref:ABC transporter n=2 Tax=Pandoraea TaxID=93217 RepID=A0A5E4W1N1_9BURK|nr:ABC transporter substrate-binding protein [Pandoraea nosoerga]MBN4676280.1 ABC transporter substrate-binding protein [Pandoraea nosoerga]MBN4681317.1 ABC transporter substrate-binding protein [Pandoraea nosoerga]MBN4745392.1 ABC transporter substrate-binding protein [Pandoraea nosoerga]VVE17075.1 ABC transporter [Pandoraea nosoerga]